MPVPPTGPLVSCCFHGPHAALASYPPGRTLPEHSGLKNESLSAGRSPGTRARSREPVAASALSRSDQGGSLCADRHGRSCGSGSRSSVHLGCCRRRTLPALSLNFPAARVVADNPVPMAQVMAVAAAKAAAKWGQVSPGEPIPLVDQDGKLAYYMVPFHFGTDPFPCYEQIMQGVRGGRAFVAEVEKGVISPELAASAPAQAIAPEVILHANFGQPRAERPSAAGIPEAEYQKAFKAAESLEMGMGNTARWSSPPRSTDIQSPSRPTTCRCSTGPALAQARSKGFLDGEPVLNRIYFLGVRGMYFEFASGGNAATLQAFTLESERSVESRERHRRQWNSRRLPRPGSRFAPMPPRRSSPAQSTAWITGRTCRACCGLEAARQPPPLWCWATGTQPIGAPRTWASGSSWTTGGSAPNFPMAPVPSGTCQTSWRSSESRWGRTWRAGRHPTTSAPASGASPTTPAATTSPLDSRAAPTAPGG